MALVFGTNYHNFSVSFDDFALVAHRFDGRSDFHNNLLFLLRRKDFRTQTLFICHALSARMMPSYDLLLQVILPLVKS